MDELSDLVLMVPCPRCEALPGESCRTVTGNRSSYTHVPRRDPVWFAYGRGYVDGEQDGQRNGLNGRRVA